MAIRNPRVQIARLCIGGGVGDDGWVKESKDETVIRVSDASSGRELCAFVREIGGDVVIAVGGGDRPHVGCVVLAVPNTGRTTPTVSVLTIPPHKEEPIARAVAEAVCRRCRRVAVVTAGVHEDGIDGEGIGTYLRLAGELAMAAADRIDELG